MRTCGVRIWKGDGNSACQLAGDCVSGCTYGCRIGCFNPARFRNPFYGKESHDDTYWWRGMYNYVEWLCAECYDDMIRDAREWETVFQDHEDYEEDPAFTAILDTL